MENSDAEKGGADDASQLARNRSFKAKQLVRSQAIRESQSPPRTASPAVEGARNKNTVSVNNFVRESPQDERCDDHKEFSEEKKKQQVEIQITSGGWDEGQSDQRQRTRRWLGQKQHSRDLLSNNPRVACVCGTCNACPQCRGRRRRHLCPKQDSGIVCSDDCGDGSDSEHTGSIAEVDDQNYCRCPERKEKPKSISLSRTDSDEKSEPTGPELVAFIKATLNKNSKDRMTLLKIERELHALVNDTGRCIVRFPVMSSYGRMLVHRCASLFQLAHHLDQASKTSVTVSKSGTCGGRIPCTPFKQWCTTVFPSSPLRHGPAPLAKSILKRDTHSLDEPGTGPLSAARSKSLEQREREYERVRRRIFSTDNCTHDESQWPWLSGPVKVLAPDTRNKLLKVQSLEGSVPPGRGAVSKSHSFGGYHTSAAETPRLLSRHGDLASSSWRLSPSSSGYRTLSLHSTDSVTPSPTGGASPEPSAGEPPALVWAVTDLAAVPRGALVIHPQTGRPLTNPDGSVYHFDPNNPPVLCDYADKLEQNCDKRRGKLEKQNSFIDNDCECPPEETRKCCCECRRHETCQRNADKVTNQTEQKTNQKPASPCKNRYEKIVDPPTNHSAPPDLATNHRTAYNPTPNQNQAESVSTNQYQVYEASNQSYHSSPNQRLPYDSNPRQGYEPTNQRAIEMHRPPSFDGQKYEPPIQRSPNDVIANHRPVKLTNQESPEIQYMQQHNYPHYRQDEMTSPHMIQNHAFVQQDMANLQAMVQHKMTPVPMPDPNIRPVSLTNMMYPGVPQGFQFINQLRMEQQMQPGVFQQVIPVQEDQKHAPSPHTDNTFRIDPSYPYPPLDYAAQCGACADPPLQQQRFAVPYAQPEAPVVPTYVPNVLLQQPPVHYPYQEQWPGVQPMQPKLFVHELLPLMHYPQIYPPYQIYPQQVLPQPYPVVASAPAHAYAHAMHHAGNAARHKRASQSGSSRNTPLQTPPEEKKVPYEDTTNSNREISQNSQSSLNSQSSQNSQISQPELSRQNSNEIAVKIQQIKEQMAQVNTGDKGKREEWRRRNSGNGILGSYPVGNFNGRVIGRPANDETQLSSAARAIVNSIRNMQAKNTYQQDRREFGWQRGERQQARGEQRPPRSPREPNCAPPYLLRQISPNTWVKRSPGPIHPVLNQPRRPHPDNRNARR